MVLFEDDYYIIVNKPPLLLVHPNKKLSNEKDNLMARVRDLINQPVNIINRIDRPVSGIVLFGKTTESVKLLKEQWHGPNIQKKYLGLVRTRFTEAGSFDFPLNSEKKILQEALTKYTPLKLYETSTLLEIEIFTGRHHQIRRHFARSVRHLLGDRTYGKKKYNDYYRDQFGLERVFLHAHRFECIHPYTNEHIVINCPLPADLSSTLELMNSELLENFTIPDYIELHG